MRTLYNWAARLFALVAIARLAWLSRGDSRYRDDLAQRFGRVTVTPGAAWIHAASVGEVQAAVPLVTALRARMPRQSLLLTTGSLTGRDRARAVLPADVEIRYAPFDLPGAVRRFLDRARPAVAIFLETELWPNLVAGIAAREVPLVLASGRVSASSTQRYARFARGLIAETMQSFTTISAQSAADAERFIALGAAPARVRVSGNIKFDFTLPDDLQASSGDLRARYLPEPRPVWVAGSTHPGEEEQVLDAHRAVLQDFPRALLVMAPRRPQRFDAAAEAVRAAGFTCIRRSGEAAADGSQVLLVDALGELLAWYALADVVFVGGSLVPVGGHNLLEPAALGRPVLAGPHLFAAPQVARLLREAGGVEIVADAASLAHTLRGLLADGSERARRGARAHATLEENRGTAAKIVAVIEPLLLAEPALTAPAEPDSARAGAPAP